MTNYVHLLVSGEVAESVSGLMQSVGRRYVRYCNATYKRTGALFEDRFKSSLIEWRTLFAYLYALYIELNPVRAGIIVGLATAIMLRLTELRSGFIARIKLGAS